MNEEQIIPGSEEEKILIKGCVDWQRASQNKLYSLFSRKMFAVSYRYSDSREEAEETFQDGFIKVFEHIGQFRHEGSLEGWMRKIFVNVALRKYKRKLQSIETVSLEDQSRKEYELTGYHSDDVESKIEVNKIMKLIDQLPPAYKVVFNLYEFEGMKHNEIAAQLGISEGTSKSNLSRAKTILQKALIADKANQLQKV